MPWAVCETSSLLPSSLRSLRPLREILPSYVFFAVLAILARCSSFLLSSLRALRALREILLFLFTTEDTENTEGRVAGCWVVGLLSCYGMRDSSACLGLFARGSSFPTSSLRASAGEKKIPPRNVSNDADSSCNPLKLSAGQTANRPLTAGAGEARGSQTARPRIPTKGELRTNAESLILKGRPRPTVEPNSAIHYASPILLSQNPMSFVSPQAAPSGARLQETLGVFSSCIL